MKKININNFDEVLYYEKLDNGLDVYMLPYENKKVNTAILGVRFGGKDLNFKTENKTYNIPSGVAHFLEHKVFETNDMESPFTFYSKNSATTNAGTSFISTNYYFQGSKYFKENLEYLLDFVSSLYLTEENIQKEKGIIIEEAKMYQDNPDWVLYDKLRYNVYVNDTLRCNLAGSIEDIKQVTKKDLEVCYKYFYNPKNMFLVLAGTFNKDEILTIIKENKRLNKLIKLDVEKISLEEPDQVFLPYEEVEFNTSNYKLALGIKINKNLFPIKDDYILKNYLYMILSLGFGNVSEFKDEMRKRKLLLYLGHELLNTKNHITITFMMESKKPKELLSELKKYLGNLKFKKEDFERIKKVWISSEIKMIDDVVLSADNIVSDIINYNEYKNNRISDIKSMDFETLNKVIDSLNFDNQATVVIKPKSNK